MEKGVKVIAVLLLLAIVFSAFSIILSISVMNMELPEQSRGSNYGGGGNGVASVGFVVESSNGADNG